MRQDGGIVLTAGDAQADISLAGGELTRWCIGGRELLWRADAAIWDRTSPLLFPVVGWCRDQTITIDGASYSMPVHGFAAGEQFTIEDNADDSVSVVLRDTAATRRSYPYAFCLRVTYVLTPDTIAITMAVTNEDSRALHYACGLHPGFAVPFAGGAMDEYRIEFEYAEDPSVPVIAPGGLFSDAHRPVPLDGRTLTLTPELFSREALCFLNAKSRQISLGRPGHGRITMDVQNFPHLAIWSQPGAPFVSLEAWTGYGDPENFRGELAEKPSMIALLPGETRVSSARISFAT